VQQVADADIVFGYITPEMLAVARQLQWIQAPISSFGYYNFSWGPYYIFPALVSYPATLTSSSGIYNDIIGTHVFALITAIARNLPAFIRQQQDHLWLRGGHMFSLSKKTIAIIGFGGVGKEVARLANAFRMTVVAVDPDPRGVPSYVSSHWSPDELHEVMSRADFVVLCLPDAPGTLRLIGESELRAMKSTAYLINIGRGNTVDLQALTQALTEKWIAGAGLDVFGPGFEPLPSNHPLWACENVLITPHRAGAGTPVERRVTVFLENFRRFTLGVPLLNVVDKQRMVVNGPRFQLAF
jgi:phosphoglycerate dehydrogenase-like enzyme